MSRYSLLNLPFRSYGNSARQILKRNLLLNSEALKMLLVVVQPKKKQSRAKLWDSLANPALAHAHSSSSQNVSTAWRQAYLIVIVPVRGYCWIVSSFLADHMHTICVAWHSLSALMRR